MPEIDVLGHNKVEYPIPFLVMADNNYPCRKWEDAMNDTNFKELYDEMSDDEKEKIAQNLSNRTCLAFSGGDKCYTVNGVLESCKQLPKEKPNSIAVQMGKVDAAINASKEPTLTKLSKLVEQKREKLSSLIEQHTTRQNMIKMNTNFKRLTLDNLNDQEKKEVDLINDLNQIDNTKQYTEETLKILRDNVKWYEYYNQKMRTIIWYLLILLILAIMLFMMSIRSGSY
jgi:hypothetical protein